jgi:phage gp29-like protein
MPRLLDQYGRPIEAALLREPQTSRVANLQNEYLQGQLDGLTPARVSRLLKLADDGDLWAQHRLFSDMEERDAHLYAEIGKRRRAPLCLDWTIEPPRGASAAEKAHAEWLTEVLTDAADPFEELLVALMDGIGHGFASVELEWLKNGQDLLPAFHPRPQEWFRLDRSRRELRLRDASADGAPLQPFGWVLHTYGKAKTGYLGRMGLHRVLVWPFLYKAFAIGDFAEFLETFGLPMITGKYFSGATDDEKASLLRAVTALGHDARAIMPAEMELEIQSVTGSGQGSPHLAMVDWSERSQSKAILGQTMSAEAKSTGIGSGNADLHDDVRKDILKADVRQLEGTITRDLLYPLLALNRGGIDSLSRCPRLVFDTGEAEDLAAYADSLPKLVAVGMKKIPLAWVHEKLRIPEAADGEESLGVAAPAAPAGGGNLPPGKDPAANPDQPPPDQLAPGKEAAALVALTAQARAAAEQDALDQLAEAMGEEWQPTIDGLLSPVDKLAGQVATLEEFRDRLPEVIGKMDAPAVADLLARGLFAAYVAGRAIPGKAQ